MNTKFIFPAANPSAKKYENIDKNFLKLLKNIKNTKVIFFHPEEHSTNIEGDDNICKKIEKTLRNNNSTLEIWIGNFFDIDDRLGNIDQNLIKIVNWPKYLMLLSYYHYKYKHNDFGHLSVDKLYTCLNRRQNYHRAVLMRELFENNLENDGYISYLTYDFDPFKLFKKIFSKKIVLDTSGLKTWPPYGDFYHKSLINVVTETTTDVPDISEKTWFSILHKRPFVILGYPGIHKKLKEMGFLLYDSIIDYSFDDNDDLDFRINAIINNLIKLKNCNYQEEFDKLRPMLEHNHTVFLKHIADESVVPKLFFEYCDKFKSRGISQYDQIIKSCK
jgi:hypothetical protein